MVWWFFFRRFVIYGKTEIPQFIRGVSPIIDTSKDSFCSIKCQKIAIYPPYKFRFIAILFLKAHKTKYCSLKID